MFSSPPARALWPSRASSPVLDVRTPVHYRCNPAGAVLVISDIWRCAGREIPSPHVDVSALRECDESRGTRYSERHSAQIDAHIDLLVCSTNARAGVGARSQDSVKLGLLEPTPLDRCHRARPAMSRLARLTVYETPTSCSTYFCNTSRPIPRPLLPRSARKRFRRPRAASRSAPRAPSSSSSWTAVSNWSRSFPPN